MIVEGIRVMEVSDYPEPSHSFWDMNEPIDYMNLPFTTHLEIAVESKVLGGWVLIGPVPERGLR